jgi:DNA-binding response OmpR family regulator
MRILVIEDERTLTGFVEQSLRAEGHSVSSATMAKAARQRLRAAITRSSCST